MKRYCIFAACLLAWLTAHAGRDFHFSIGELSDNRFQAICEDRSGFIWIGTENGLNRFDGYSFYQFTHQDNDSLSLVSNYVRSLTVDNDGTLWVGTSRGIQFLSNGETAFNTVKLPRNRTPYIVQLEQFRDGTIWAATSGRGIYLISPNNPYEGRQFEYSGDSPLPLNVVRAILEDMEGTVWIGTPEGVVLYRPSDQTLSVFQPDVIDGEITGLTMDPHGDVYITTNRHLYKWKRSNFSLVRLTDSDGIWEITHSYMDREGNLAICVRGEGLLKITREMLADNENFDYDRYLEDLDVSVIYKDRSGNKWIGCFLSDLILSSESNNLFGHWNFQDYSEPVQGTVTAMTTDSEGNLLLGYNNKGLTCLDSHGRVVFNERYSSYADCLFRDSRDQIWVGLSSGGMSRLNPRTHRLEMMVTCSSSVPAIAEDSQGRIYFAELGNGFSRYDPNDQTVSLFSDFGSESSESARLSNMWIHSMKVAGSNLWIGHDNGVECFDLNTSSFIDIPKLKEGSGSAGCYAIVVDNMNRVWMGTTRGLMMYDPKSDVFRRFTKDNGLTGNDIRGMEMDVDGTVWLTTINGLNRVDMNTLEIRSYYSDDNTFNRISAFDSQSGRVYFGNNFGITYFNPNALESGTAINPVILTGFYQSGKNVNSYTTPGRTPKTYLPLNMMHVSDFRMKYRDDSFTMEFSTLNYGDEGKIIYEYTFSDPLKEEWNSGLAGINRISFVHLKPGRHKLYVRARLNELTSEPTLYTIRIDSPWYASFGAICVYLILFVGILTGVFLFLKKKREQEVSDTKLDAFINVAHEICAPMSMVISPLEELIQDDTLPQESMNRLKQIHRSSTRILSLVNQLLDIRKFDEGRMELHYAETDIVGFLLGSFELYTQTAEHRNISFTFTHPMTEQNVWIDRDCIDKVMMNLLSNAFKYTPDDGAIDVSIMTGSDESERGPLHDYVQVSVSDTGIGFDPALVDKLFNRFYRVENELTQTTLGMGIGLNYSKILVDMHHGTIFASSRADTQQGSVFSFRLPLGHSHLKPEEIVEPDQAERLQLTRERKSIDDYTPSTVKPSKNPIKVLVVDDDDQMLEYLADNLRQSYRVITCRNGQEGLKTAIALQPHLIITDVVMPEMDGIQLVKALKGNSEVSHIPVIMLSGKNKLQDRMEGIDTGADHYLSKPFYMSELKSIMSNLINNRLIVKGKYSGKQEQKDHVNKVHFLSSDEVLMKRIMEVVNKNLSNSSFNIESIVDEVGISRTQLHRKLKELTGFSAAKFVQNLRMQQAAELLKEGKANIAEIAYSVGFASQSHFATTFKQYYGLTPSEYLRQYNEENGSDSGIIQDQRQ